MRNKCSEKLVSSVLGRILCLCEDPRASHKLGRSPWVHAVENLILSDSTKSGRPICWFVSIPAVKCLTS